MFPLAIAGIARVRQAVGKAVMNWIYALSGGLALLVLVYLLVALFYPEKF